MRSPKLVQSLNSRRYWGDDKEPAASQQGLGLSDHYAAEHVNLQGASEHVRPAEQLADEQLHMQGHIDGTHSSFDDLTPPVALSEQVHDAMF